MLDLKKLPEHMSDAILDDDVNINGKKKLEAKRQPQFNGFSRYQRNVSAQNNQLFCFWYNLFRNV